MGKVTRFTGSKLLGAELRRLRGGRSLKQIAELSKTPPLSERVFPVAAPTLSQIENGISFPSLETIHSIALIYKTSVQQLLDLVVQERLLATGPPPVDQDAARQQFAEALSRGQWHEALRVATWGEQARTGSEALSWRANRAQCLNYLGMTCDAISLLEECLSSQLLRPSSRYQVHLALAEAQAQAGHLLTARLHVRAADEHAPEGLPVAESLRILRAVAYVLLQPQDLPSDEADARRAVRMLEKAQQLADAELEGDKLLIATHLAYARARGGNRLAGTTELERVIEAARSASARRPLVEALVALGTLRREGGKRADALRLLDEAASLASDLGDANQAFEACFQAYRCVEGRDGRKAAYYLARCERFHPLLQGRSRTLQEFEAAAWGGA